MARTVTVRPNTRETITGIRVGLLPAPGRLYQDYRGYVVRNSYISCPVRCCSTVSTWRFRGKT